MTPLLSSPDSGAGVGRLDHVCGLLGDHDGGRVGVPRDEARHDGRIHDAEATDAIDAEEE